MKLAYKNGITSVVLRVKLLDSTSTTGAGLTGLTSASAGLRISTIADNESTATAYTAAGSTTETITTLGTFAAPTATKCRFKEVDATNHPGVYEIQIADARWAISNARSVIVTVQATGAAQVDAEVQLANVPADALTLGGAAITLGLTGSNTLTLNGTAITLLDPAGVTTLLSRITSTRAGYLDNLNIGGLVASAAAVLNIQNNTFIASDVPYMMERPDAGSETVPITFIFCDDTGAAKDLDSGNPVLTLTNNAGTDLSARLAGGGATWTHVGTGEYKILYTNTSSDAIAELVWKVTGTINAVARKMVYRTQLVDTTAIDFTSSDRTDLQTILARQPSASGAAGLNTAGEYQAAHNTWPGETAAGQAVTGISGVQSQVESLQEDVDNLVNDVAALGGGGGQFLINHDSGGTDALRVMHGGDPVRDANIRAYVQSDYAAGGRSHVGQSTTGTDGRWLQDIKLDADDYVLTFEAQDSDFSITSVAIRVASDGTVTIV